MNNKLIFCQCVNSKCKKNNKDLNKIKKAGFKFLTKIKKIKSKVYSINKKNDMQYLNSNLINSFRNLRMRKRKSKILL